MRRFFLQYFILFFTAFILMSCEEVIDLDLNDAEPRIVIEGAVTQDNKPCLVRVSTTGDFYTGEGMTAITDAKVNLSSDNGYNEDLFNAGNGFYYAVNLLPEAKVLYTLTVKHGDIIYSASDSMPEKTVIEKLDYNISELGGEGPEQDEYDIHYDINCYFNDKEGIKNYYLLQLKRNNEIVDNRRGKYYLLVDDYLDGEMIAYTFFGIGANNNDTIEITLSAVGPATYEYYRTLNDVLIQGGMGTTPYNPVTNFNNNALGYFGTFTFDSREIIIENRK
jgi:hypothetical protein